MEKLQTTKTTLLMCIIEIILGALLFINPQGFTSGIIILLGIVLAFMGMISIIDYFKKEPEEAAERNDFAKGLIFVLSGIFCIFKSDWFISTFPVLTVIYGLISLIMGIGKIQQMIDMIRLKRKYWFIALMGAALTLIFAAMILINPFAATDILWKFIAVTLIIEAIIDIFTIIFEKK